MRLAAFFSVALFGAVLFLRASQASAAEPLGPSPRELFSEGKLAYGRGHYQRALKAFEAALKMEHRPSLILNIAQCHRQLRHDRRALSFYRRYLATCKGKHASGAAPFHDEVRMYIATLENGLAAETPSPKPPLDPPQPPEIQKRPEKPSLLKAAAERRRKTIWGYSALSVGLTASAATAIIYTMGLVQRSDAHTRYLSAREQQEIDAHWADIESAQQKIVIGHVLLGSSLAALGLSAYLLFTRPSGAASPSKAIPHLAFYPAMGGGMLQLGANF